MYSPSFMPAKIHCVSREDNNTGTICVVPNVVTLNYYLPMKKMTDQQPVKPKWAYIAESVMSARKITQEDLLPVFGKKTRGAIGHYFRGRRQPDINQMIALAKFLKLTLSELVGEIPLAEESQQKREAEQLLAAIDPASLPILLGALRGMADQLPKRKSEEND